MPLEGTKAASPAIGKGAIKYKVPSPPKPADGAGAGIGGAKRTTPSPPSTWNSSTETDSTKRVEKYKALRRAKLMEDYKMQYQERYNEMKAKMKEKHLAELRRRKEARDAAVLLAAGTAVRTPPPPKAQKLPSEAALSDSPPGLTGDWQEDVKDAKSRRQKPKTKEEKAVVRKKMMDDYKRDHKAMRAELKERLKRQHLAELKIIQEDRRRRHETAAKRREEALEKKRNKPKVYRQSPGKPKPKARLVPLGHKSVRKTPGEADKVGGEKEGSGKPTTEAPTHETGGGKQEHAGEEKAGKPGAVSRPPMHSPPKLGGATDAKPTLKSAPTGKLPGQLKVPGAGKLPGQLKVPGAGKLPGQLKPPGVSKAASGPPLHSPPKLSGDKSKGASKEAGVAFATKNIPAPPAIGTGSAEAAKRDRGAPTGNDKAEATKDDSKPRELKPLLKTEVADGAGEDKGSA